MKHQPRMSRHMQAYADGCRRPTACNRCLACLTQIQKQLDEAKVRLQEKYDAAKKEADEKAAAAAAAKAEADAKEAAKQAYRARLAEEFLAKNDEEVAAQAAEKAKVEAELRLVPVLFVFRLLWWYIQYHSDVERFNFFLGYAKVALAPLEAHLLLKYASIWFVKGLI